MDLKKIFTQRNNTEELDFPESEELDFQEAEIQPRRRKRILSTTFSDFSENEEEINEVKNAASWQKNSSEDTPNLIASQIASSNPGGKTQDFFAAPINLEETSLNFAEVQNLLLKTLAKKSTASGKELALELRLPLHGVTDPILSNLYNQKYIDVIQTSGLIGANKIYKLTNAGYQRAEDASRICSYLGPAPVSLDDYIFAVENYSEISFTPNELEEAYQGLIISPEAIRQIGPALLSGKSLFLYGPPGTGKTSIAERITRCYQSTIKIPFAVNISGSTVRFFDSFWHKPVNPEELEKPELHQDNRWIEIERPCILVGPEFKTEATHIQSDSNGQNLQFPNSIKANGGVFIIDDFGRQQEKTEILFNRWIVPLGRRKDILSLPRTGQQVTLPFRVFLVFSTNLEPKEVIDGAAIRRLGYKVPINYPDVEAFCQIFALEAEKMKIEWTDELLEYFIEKEYYQNTRPMRASDPRDILEKVSDIATFEGVSMPCELNKDLLDKACKAFFAEF